MENYVQFTTSKTGINFFKKKFRIEQQYHIFITMKYTPMSLNSTIFVILASCELVLSLDRGVILLTRWSFYIQ